MYRNNLRGSKRLLNDEYKESYLSFLLGFCSAERRGVLKCCTKVVMFRELRVLTALKSYYLIFGNLFVCNSISSVNVYL